MKKVFYLFAILFSVVLMNTSCEKNDPTPDPIVPDQTLAEQYPDWSDLTWVSTNGDTDLTVRPQISFSITGDIITLKYKTDVSDYTFEYKGFELTSATVSLFLSTGGGFNQTFDVLDLDPPDATKIKLYWQENTYVLQKN